MSSRTKPTIIVSPNERLEVKEALGEMGLESPIPFDFLMFTSRGKVARERKVFPDDFLASVSDGRFSKECAAMREVSQFPGVILEGDPIYTKEGFLLVGRRPSRWTKKAVRNLIRSLEYAEGCLVEWSSDILGTIELLKETYDYFNKDRHTSLRTRPGLQSNWLTPTGGERLVFFYQGLPGISVVRATKLADVFPSPDKLFQATEADITTIPGLGKKLAGGIVRFLHPA